MGDPRSAVSNGAPRRLPQPSPGEAFAPARLADPDTPVALETLDVTSNVPAESAVDLYRHEVRPEWGLALMVREEDRFRAYQFEDGRLRKIREDFDDLMRPVDEMDVPDAVV